MGSQEERKLQGRTQEEEDQISGTTSQGTPGTTNKRDSKGSSGHRQADGGVDYVLPSTSNRHQE
eukprot:12929551-Prorocentrum_lima.AAC.1